jgi:hypothetical protein
MGKKDRCENSVRDEPIKHYYIQIFQCLHLKNVLNSIVIKHSPPNKSWVCLVAVGMQEHNFRPIQSKCLTHFADLISMRLFRGKADIGKINNFSNFIEHCGPYKIMLYEL